MLLKVHLILLMWSQALNFSCPKYHIIVSLEDSWSNSISLDNLVSVLTPSPKNISSVLWICYPKLLETNVPTEFQVSQFSWIWEIRSSCICQTSSFISKIPVWYHSTQLKKYILLLKDFEFKIFLITSNR